MWVAVHPHSLFSSTFPSESESSSRRNGLSIDAENISLHAIYATPKERFQETLDDEAKDPAFAVLRLHIDKELRGLVLLTETFGGDKANVGLRSVGPDREHF
jgi:hypothetical protein